MHKNSIYVEVAHHHPEQCCEHSLFGVLKVGKSRGEKSAVGLINEQRNLFALLGKF